LGGPAGYIKAIVSLIGEERMLVSKKTRTPTLALRTEDVSPFGFRQGNCHSILNMPAGLAMEVFSEKPYQASDEKGPFRQPRGKQRSGGVPRSKRVRNGQGDSSS